MDLLPQVLVNGLTVGGTYALAAVGISLIFGVLNIINFGQGAAATVGAFAAMVVLTRTGLGVVPAFLIGVSAAFLTGFVTERIAVKPLRDAPLLMPLITTLGIGIVIENGVRFIFGPETKPFPTAISRVPFAFGDTTISLWEAVTMAVVVVVIAALQFMLTRTNFGISVRAIAEDRRAAELIGINVNRAILLTFCLASALGGLAGVLAAALYNSINPTMGSASMLKAFAASVLGGMEQIVGAIVGGLILGVAEAATSVYISTSWRDGVAMLLLVLVLVFWPAGLLGKRHLEKAERPSLNVMPLPPVPRLGLGQPGLIIGFAVAALLPVFVHDAYYLRVMTIMALYGTLALSLNLIAGFAGIISLGHAAFYGLGAYASAIFATRLGFPVWLAFPSAIVFAALCGVAFAWPVMRLRGHYIAMGTLGLAAAINVVMLNWIGLTRGPMGIPAIPPPRLFGHDFTNAGYFYAILVILAVATLLVIAVLDSPFGRSLRAMRDDELGAASVGVNIRVVKMTVFGLSAAIAGACGGFWAHYISFISPDSFTPIESIGILSMVVLGGLGSIPGSILGGAVLSALPEVLRFASDYRQAIYGLAIMLVVLYRPQGLLGFSQRTNRTQGTARGPASANAAS